MTNANRPKVHSALRSFSGNLNSPDTTVGTVAQQKREFEVERLSEREVSRLALAFLERRIAVLHYENGMDENPHQAGMLRSFLEQNEIVGPEKASLLYYTEPTDQNGHSKGGVEIFQTEDVNRALLLTEAVRTSLNEGSSLPPAKPDTSDGSQPLGKLTKSG